MSFGTAVYSAHQAGGNVRGLQELTNVESAATQLSALRENPDFSDKVDEAYLAVKSYADNLRKSPKM